jgi:cysteinyl-tRNA synthetase
LGRPNHLQQRQDRSQDKRRQGRNVPRPRHHHQIIALVKQLVTGGHAYELDDGWYFDLASFPDYGKLSGRIDSRPGGYRSRIEHRVGKRNQP